MENSYDSGLLVSTLSDVALEYLPTAIGSFKSFTTDFSDQQILGSTSIKVPLSTGAGPAIKNPTSFNVSTSSLGTATVTLAPFTAPFSVSAVDFSNGKRLQTLAKQNLNRIIYALKGEVNALITGSVFTNSVVSVAEASFAASNAQTAWASIKSGEKNLLLSPTAFSKLLPTALTSFQKEADGSLKGFAGFDSVFVDGYWTGAQSGVYGIAVNPAAIAMASGLPKYSAQVMSGFTSSDVITLPELGLSLVLNTWTDMSTRETWASYDINFGVASGDVSALTIIKS